MGFDPMQFWHLLKDAKNKYEAGDKVAATQLLQDAYKNISVDNAELDEARIRLLELTAKTCNLDFERPGNTDQPTGKPAKQASGATPKSVGQKISQLGPITSEGRDGISLVTCAMNRSENLLKALKTWIAHPEISEIVIVDWSSDKPVSETLQEEGITDKRIRIVRVDGEPRWILSYAFNVGFRVAACKHILKVDADIVLDPAFFEKNQLKPNHFIAGNWRTAVKSQAYVNGFFLLHKSDMAVVGGFNEYIKTYGWDDDDIYERLVLSGVTRQDVDNETIHHLPHSDEERTGQKDEQKDEDDQKLSAKNEIMQGTLYLIRRNYFLANAMPGWNSSQILLPFEGESFGNANMSLHRRGWVPSTVPDHVNEDADYYALTERASLRLGQKVRNLNRLQLQRLISQPFARLTNLDIEVCLRVDPESPSPKGGYLVINLSSDVLAMPRQAVSCINKLQKLGEKHGLSLILRGSSSKMPDGIAGTKNQIPYIPEADDIGKPTAIDVSELGSGPDLANEPHFVLDLNGALVGELTKAMPAPAASKHKPQLFVDAQHGLGNRMRAIGSAAAFAQKTDRELVIVWEPDHHCEGRFADLFDYDGAVIEEAFIESATADGCEVFNYMEIEEGAQKDALITGEGNNDIYFRSAYVLNSPHSNWQEDNKFLHDLTPVEEVRDLVASVRNPNDLSAHVRMEAGEGLDHNTYDSVENWTEEGHQLIHKWRAKSHFSHFMKRIDQLVAENRAERIFLATDLPETYQEFVDTYGDRIAYLSRDIFDRSAQQLTYALADVLLLGRSPLLLGSTWSSFSELALRMSPQKMAVEMSGKDF